MNTILKCAFKVSAHVTKTGLVLDCSIYSDFSRSLVLTLCVHIAIVLHFYLCIHEKESHSSEMTLDKTVSVCVYCICVMSSELLDIIRQ